MAAPVDSARQGTNVSTAGTSHAVNVGSPSAGTLLIVLARFAAAPGTVTFTGYSSLNGSTGDASDATDDSTFVFWRWADGTEGATDTCSTANSVKAAFISWEVTGAQNEAPGISTVAVGTTTANTANPGSAAPPSAPQDTLYLALAGGDGEVGAYTAAPTNYANIVAANSGTGGTAASNVLIGGASRQITASSSDDPAAFTHAAHTTGWTAYTVAISTVRATTHQGAGDVAFDPAIAADGTNPKTETAVARISLASGDTPTVRTGHTIKIRARVTSGAGTLRAALYEGSDNRSGNLETSALSTSLAEYSLPIAQADAEDITDYSDLELRVWGYAVAGGSIVFEVAEAKLEIPAGVPTHQGEGDVDFDPTIAAAGTRDTFAVGDVAFSPAIASAGDRSTFTVGDVAYAPAIAGAGDRTTFGVGDVSFAPTIAADGTVTGGATEHQGAADLTFAPAIASESFNEAFAVGDVGFSPSIAGAGTRETFGVSDLAFAPLISGDGIRQTATVSDVPFAPAIATAGTLEAFSSAPMTFAPAIASDSVRDTSGAGDVAFSPAIAADGTVSTGATEHFGAADLTFAPSVASSSFLEQPTSAALGADFTLASAGQLGTFDTTSVALSASLSAAATRETFTLGGVTLSPVLTADGLVNADIAEPPVTSQTRVRLSRGLTAAGTGSSRTRVLADSGRTVVS
jgi:hypothetical protein